MGLCPGWGFYPKDSFHNYQFGEVRISLQLQLFNEGFLEGFFSTYFMKIGQNKKSTCTVG